MSNPMIQVEKLSKSYWVGHQSEQGGRRYQALRDVLAQQGRQFYRKAVDMLKGRQIIQGDRVEEFYALRDVSFDVHQGEVIGVIGRNGAGKSTLLKVLSRITEPTGGRVVLRGRVASLLEVGTGFHPELTGRENIFLNGAILGMKRAEIRRKFDEIVAFAGVERFLDTPVKRYSSGMYVRLAFAVAAHLEPEILVVDEVLAVGDAEFQKKCLGKMHDIANKEGRTVLFVSHNMAAIRTLCSRAILLNGGQLSYEGSVEKAVDSYLTSGDADEMASLSFHADKGRGEACSLSILGETRSLRMFCGERLKIGVRFESPEEHCRVGFSIVIRRMDDTPAVGMGTHVQAVKPSTAYSRRWLLEADLGKIPLNAGNYQLSLYVIEGEREVARFSRAFSLTVVEADVFGWGKSLPAHRSWGDFYWVPQWSIQVDEG